MKRLLHRLFIATITTSRAFQPHQHHHTLTTPPSTLTSLLTLNSAMWDPQTQTFQNGVPSHHTFDIDELLSINGGKLKIFGYGSLCWHPGKEGVLSLAKSSSDVNRGSGDSRGCDGSASGKSGDGGRVTTTPGRAIGYQRIWSQRSADHRGTIQFNGVVCTLLSDDEVRGLHHDNEKNVSEGKSGGESEWEKKKSMTEGMIYTVDEELVEDCLAELDFREKGGYARDVIDVIEDDTGNTVKELLYRGTPENPAFWKRAFLDLAYAAAIISVAVGPSGPNDIYLLHLHEFLSQHSKHTAAVDKHDHAHDDRTSELAHMVTLLKSKYRPYFLFGSGSNEYNQLLLKNVGLECEDVEEVNEITEMLLVVPRHDESSDYTSAINVGCEPKSIHAGGGHSAILTTGGELYLWGWNDSNQLGTKNSICTEEISTNFPNLVQPLDIKVETVDLGHTHTLLIEKKTGRLFAFGDNGRGQVTASPPNDSCLPQIPLGLEEECFVDVASGLFHSAAITQNGELVTWGCGRYGQCLVPVESTIGRWSPADGKLIRVACGRRHTIMLDEYGRVWSMGDNKYGQLGRHTNSNVKEPQLVDGQLGQRNSGCFAIHSGWSHVLALVRRKEGVTLYGWGRNDKGQLGSSRNQFVSTPLELLMDQDEPSVQSACCGAESSHIINDAGDIYSTGWNEHGNLGIGLDNDGSSIEEKVSLWKKTTGANVVGPPPCKMKKLFAAGGAHLISMVI